MNNIILTGLSGSGKTTLGRLLAKHLQMQYIDTDCVIEEQTGMPIIQTFAMHGEPYFRDLENQVIRSIAGMENIIVATGGGAVLRKDNIDILRSTGILIFLDRPVENILQDLECSNRPLLKNRADKLLDMDRERRKIYESTADRIFANTGDLQGALLALLAEIRSWQYEKGYAVIGDPISHSLSPAIHQTVFGTLGITDDYQSIRIQKEELGYFVRRVRTSNIKGFNITSPHKKAIIPLLDEVEEQARRCGAVNTVVKRNGRLCGFNTDMDGLLLAVLDQGSRYRNSRITLLGTGGAAVGAALKAADEGAAEIRVHGRRQSAVEEVSRVVDGKVPVHKGSLDADSLRQSAVDCDLLINTLPLEMTGVGGGYDTSFLEHLPKHALVVDLVYSPPLTALLREAKALGLKVLNGLPMLIYQAILADERYLERDLDRTAFYNIIASALQTRQKEFAI